MTIKLHFETAEIIGRRGWTITKAGKYFALACDFPDPIILTRKELEVWIFQHDRNLTRDAA